jgi:predicted GIY-YIG superfamily endonuclease
MPRRIETVARGCGMTPRQVERALAHLERHGWASRVDGKRLLMAGQDCDCKAIPPVPIPDDGQDHSGQTALYRLRDSGCDLLYVGITDNLRVRMGCHRREQWWWPHVRHIAVEWYAEREQADYAETLAIAAEHPEHNKAKRPRRDDYPGQSAIGAEGGRDEGVREGWDFIWPADSWGATENEAS